MVRVILFELDKANAAGGGRRVVRELQGLAATTNTQTVIELISIQVGLLSCRHLRRQEGKGPPNQTGNL